MHNIFDTTISVHVYTFDVPISLSWLVKQMFTYICVKYKLMSLVG